MLCNMLSGFFGGEAQAGEVLPANDIAPEHYEEDPGFMEDDGGDF